MTITSEPVPTAYEALSNLMVLIRVHGQNDTKRRWAVDPQFDGIKTVFNKGGKDGDRNLARAAVLLTDKFHTAITKSETVTTFDGGTLAVTELDLTKISDAQMQAYWPEADRLARALLPRLEKTNKDAADNLRSYHDAATLEFHKLEMALIERQKSAETEAATRKAPAGQPPRAPTLKA